MKYCHDKMMIKKEVTLMDCKNCTEYKSVKNSRISTFLHIKQLLIPTKKMKFCKNNKNNKNENMLKMNSFSRLNKFQITSVFLFFVFSVGLFSFAHAQQMSSSMVEIPVPKDPMNIAMTSSNDLLYVPSFADSTITIIDTKTNKIIRQFNLEDDEQATTVLLVPEYSKMYVPIFEASKINVYSIESHSLEDVIFLPESEIVQETPPSDQIQEDLILQTGIWSLDYNPDNMLLYAADYNAHVIYVIDLNTNVIIETIDVAPIYVTFALYCSSSFA
jgi:hypothetical protein